MEKILLTTFCTTVSLFARWTAARTGTAAIGLLEFYANAFHLNKTAFKKDIIGLLQSTCSKLSALLRNVEKTATRI